MKTDFNWIQFIATCGAVLTGVASVYFSYRMNKKILYKKGLEDEQKEIYKKLNDFYGPLSLLRGKSQRLYRIFSERLKREDSEFHTVGFILTQGVDAFTPDEKILLEQILDIGKKVEELVITKSGLIDDDILEDDDDENVNFAQEETQSSKEEETLSDQLAKLLSHTSILQLAYTGKITGESSKYKNSIFPNKLDALIEQKIQFLKKRLHEIKEI